MTLSGIDVSAAGQGPAFSFAPYRGKIAFAGVKISQDLDFADPFAARNIANAHALGIPVIGYHFLHAGLSGAQQAEFFLSHAKGLLQPGRDLIAVDTEDEGLHGQTPAQADLVTAGFNNQLKKHWPSYNALCYTEVWLEPHLVHCGNMPLWEANPDGLTVTDHGPWTGGPSFGQTGQRGVDTDVFYGTAAQLAKLAIPG